MNQHNIERIPIVDDGNRLVGIVVMKDIIHTLNNALESGI
jgi:CBS domain-containing protein